MPYVEKLSLESADHAARADEIYGLVDGALAAHPAWSKVTSGYTGNTNFDAMDVWENDGTADGYQWYLIVGQGAASNSSYQGRVLFGGALEYDSATTTAKKALRGYSQVGYVDADGYPLVSAGGAEMTFALNKFAYGTSSSAGLIIPGGATQQANWVRVLVTGQVAWIGWGSPTTLFASHGVGTYTNLHSPTADQRPLAFHCVPDNVGTTVWQHPEATDSGGSRKNDQKSNNSTYRFMYGAASVIWGEVGGSSDLLYGGPVGSRLGVQRAGTIAKNTTSTANNTIGASGGFLGLAPADFLVFGRAAGVQIGDTISVSGKTYVSIDTPNATTNNPSLFVNTQPDA